MMMITNAVVTTATRLRPCDFRVSNGSRTTVARSRTEADLAELTMGQWGLGQMGQQICVGHLGHRSVLVNR